MKFPKDEEPEPIDWQETRPQQFFNTPQEYEENANVFWMRSEEELSHRADKPFLIKARALDLRFLAMADFLLGREEPPDRRIWRPPLDPPPGPSGDDHGTGVPRRPTPVSRQTGEALNWPPPGTEAPPRE